MLSDVEGVTGEMVGVYGQVLTRGDLTDDPSPVCRVDLLDALRGGDRVDLVRESVRMVLQELIEAEATEAIGAARYERTPARVTERNGMRPKVLTTKGGDVTVALPKLRQGSFFPSILEPRRRIVRRRTRW